MFQSFVAVTAKERPPSVSRLYLGHTLFVIRANLLHPKPSWFLYGLLLSIWCYSIFMKYYFQASFNLTVILSMAKITQNSVTVAPSHFHVTHKTHKPGG